MSDKDNYLDLYPHNFEAYSRVKDAYDAGNDVVSVLRATGTGKTFIALNLIFNFIQNNKNSKIILVVPSNAIIEHIHQIIDSNPKLDFKRDFPNLNIRTYQSFISLSRKELEEIECDMLVLDEFHHIGAPVWGKRINTIRETHPEMKIFGMSAYAVRDRGTSYERDMTDPGTDELFSGKVVDTYDLCDAMIDGVLPKPVYRSAYTRLIAIADMAEKRIKKFNPSSKEYKELANILSDVRKRVHEAPSMPEILKKYLKPNGKYIYFCPPFSEDGVNDIETIKKQALEWFKQFVPEEDIVIYTSTSEMGKDGKLNRDAFYNDTTLTGESAEGKFRIMFAINQYNEGVHAPNIDGAIMGRGTSSDIVFFEQLGRALSVRGNTKEMYDSLEKLTEEELREMCVSRDIPIKDNLAKEDLIEKLIAPVIIDLANNYDFIRELENNLKNRIKELRANNLGGSREIKLMDASFDIEIENQDLFEMLRYVMDRVAMSWEEMYEYAKKYYEHHGNLEVSIKFKTNNGYEYDADGKINLGYWVENQRRAYKKGTLSEERVRLLEQIGMRFDNIISTLSWEEMYEYAKKYYEYYGNLKVSRKFKTNNGYEYDENGKINLGVWIDRQKISYKKGTLSEERVRLLEQIGMRFDNLKNTLSWEEMYEYAKKYYEHHGNLEVSIKFKTNNGYEYDANGVINLGTWIFTQRTNYKNNKLSEERIRLLEKIGMRFDYIRNVLSWEEMYEYAKKYYEHHDNLKVPVKFKTNNGYEYDADGKINLGTWISTQKVKYKQGTLSEEKVILLEQIGIIWNVKENLKEIIALCLQKGIDQNKNESVISHQSLSVFKSKILFLESNNISVTDETGKLHEIFSMSNLDMQNKYNISLEELVSKYYVPRIERKDS